RSDTIAARGPVTGMVALLRPDAAFLRAGVPPVFGREGVRRLLAASVPESGASSGGAITWQPLGGGVSRDGRSGYTFGVTSRFPMSRTGFRIERYIAFWQRDAGNAAPWRIAAYAEIGGGNADA